MKRIFTSCRALTIYQPWAWAIMEGLKPVENRKWISHHRGPLLIHAGLSMASMDRGTEFISDFEIEVPPRSRLVFGALLGVVDMIDCVSNHRQTKANEKKFGDWAGDEYLFVLEEPRYFASPITYSGSQGMFTVTDKSVLRAVEQLYDG